MMKTRMNSERPTVIVILCLFSLAALTWAAPLSAQKSGKKKGKKKTKAKPAEVVEEEEAEAEAAAAAAVEAKAAAAKEKKEEMNLEAKEQAADLFFEGVILYDQGKFASALEKFTKSYALHRYWKTLYNIGMCYLELNDQPSAAAALSQFLDEGSGKIQKEIVESVASTLKKIKAKVGIIRLTGYLEGGMLTIDGVENPRGAAGADVYVTPGVHHVKLTSQNLLLLDKKITIEGGEEKEIFVVEPTEDMIQKAKIIEDEGKKGPSEEEIRELEKRKKMKTAGWAFFGLTVAFLAAGGAAGGVALARKNDVVKIEDDYLELFNDEGSTQQELDVLSKRRDDRYSESMNSSIASTALFSAAGATALISFILLPLGYKKMKIETQPEPEEKQKPESDKKIGFDLHVAPDSLGFSLHF